jgi:hypothetical protein
MQFVRRDVWHVTSWSRDCKNHYPKRSPLEMRAKSANWHAAGKPGRPARIDNCRTTPSQRERAVCTCGYRLSNTRGSGSRESKKEHLG